MKTASPEADESRGNSYMHKEVHISGDNISLYVEICRPECEITHKTVDKVESLEEDSGSKNMVVTDNEESEFATGDVVWVSTKTKTWWPGKIEDPQDAGKFGVKNEPNGRLLICYLASRHISWYHPFQVKPFYENFMQMSSQNKSKGFIAAVEKAVNEFSNCLKSRLTSSYSHLASIQSSSNIVKSNRPSIISAFGDISATLMNSRDLILHLKNLASARSKYRVLEPAILWSYLSAFYCSLNDIKLPVNLTCSMANDEVAVPGSEGDLLLNCDNLSGDKIGSDQSLEDVCNSEVIEKRSGRMAKLRNKKSAKYCKVRDTNDNKVECPHEPIIGEEGSVLGLIEKGHDSRTRKKSRYLSYPYINLEGKKSSIKVDDELVGSGSVVKDTSNCQQKLKLLHDIPVDKFLCISSVKLLLGLRIAALNYSSPDESENIERIKGFFYKFRSFLCPVDMFIIDEMHRKIAEREKNEKFAELEGRKKEELSQKDCGTQLITPGGNDAKFKLKVQPFTTPVGISTFSYSPTQKSHRLPDLNSNVNYDAQSDVSGKHIFPVLLGVSEGNPKKTRKRRKEKIFGLGEVAESTAPLPDLNGTRTSASSLKNHTRAASTEINLKRRRKTSGTPIILTVSQGNVLPSKQILEAEFSKFGALKEVIAPSLEDPNVARVIFERKSDANRAHKSMKKGIQNFGGHVVKFQLHAPSKALENLSMRTASFTNGILSNSFVNPQGSAARTGNTPIQVQVLVPAPVPIQIPPPVLGHSPALQLNHIKKNLEMMNSMLKQEGDNISPETKAKLELEIKGLLSKVGNMGCSSSSC
ncbi:hypothetical protein SAY87_017939 [Trapa incisa]|uniref:PWWP domain-containing protein n=1 Tax=Trapa incisa TaxID=236973 RepID=A0AAN7QTC2_9MYRT|nr:hypothetical protein SAY87_017939 [Trapa incisa]